MMKNKNGKYSLLLLISVLCCKINGVPTIQLDTDDVFDCLLTPEKRVQIIRGDIRTQNVDAIVNPSDMWMNHDGGLAGVISQAAGPQLQEECNKQIVLLSGNNKMINIVEYMQKNQPVGIVTNAYDLQKKGIKKVIHVIGPNCSFNWVTDDYVIPEHVEQKNTLLTHAYKSIFTLALSRGEDLSSIAIPAISIDTFSYKPREEATVTAINTCCDEFLKKFIVIKNCAIGNNLQEIRFVLFSADKSKEQEIFNEYKKALKKYINALS